MHDDRSPPPVEARDDPGNNTARPLFWASAGFYLLIAFEFFYMASPFAAYFYAVYGPGMDGLQSLGAANWTLWFFLPHIVEHTRSPIINHAETLGVVLFVGGLAAFAIGAFQVYRAKLLKRGAVTGGLYAYIRHPQYTALIAASIGMLLIWPRFLVLFATVAVFFAYVALARVEEAECMRRYSGYGAYHSRTGMFLPRAWTAWLALPDQLFRSRWQRIAGWALVIAAALVISTIAAFSIRQLAISSLVTHRTDVATYLSIAPVTDSRLARIAARAETDSAARTILAGLPSDAAVLAYVLPTEMYVSEVPMMLPEGEQFGHSVPRDADPDRWKVVFTRAVFGSATSRDEQDAEGRYVISQAVNKEPLIEVHVRLGDGLQDADAVKATMPPPDTPFYAGHQVPVF